MAFTKITNTELHSRGATTLPDVPTISANALKQEFDAPAKEIVAPKFNNLIDELEATTAASSLGIVTPDGRTGNTVQAVVNNVSSSLALAENAISELDEDAHTHSNKALLDTYTQTEEDLASAVADDHTHSNKSVLDLFTEVAGELFYGIKRVVNNAFSKIKVGAYTVESDAEDTIEFKAGTGMNIVADPTTNSIEFISTGGSGGGDMLKAVYDVNNNSIVDKAESLDDGTTTLTPTAISNQISAIDSHIDAIEDKLEVVVTYGGKKTFAELTNALLIGDNENKFYLVSDGGYITSLNIGLWASTYIVGDHIAPDSHIAVVNMGTAASPDYRFDDFGGFVEVDEFTPSESPVNGEVTFSNLNPDYAYKIMADIPDEDPSTWPTTDTEIDIPKWSSVKRSTNADGTINYTYAVSDANIQYCLRILK